MDRAGYLGGHWISEIIFERHSDKYQYYKRVSFYGIDFFKIVQ